MGRKLIALWVVLAIAISSAVPVMASDYGDASFNLLASNGYTDQSLSWYLVDYGTTVSIVYSVSGNSVGISQVYIKVPNQEQQWTSKGSSSSGMYNFTPAYWTLFLPQLKVVYTDEHEEIFLCPLLIAASATAAQVSAFQGDPIAPYDASHPGSPGTETCSYMKCVSGECKSGYITVPEGSACPDDQCDPATEEIDCG